MTKINLSAKFPLNFIDLSTLNCLDSTEDTGHGTMVALTGRQEKKLHQNKRLRTNGCITEAAKSDITVTVRAPFFLLLILTLSFGINGCKDDDVGASDASTDTTHDSNLACNGVAPMGQCAFGSNGCCDDVITQRQLECRNGKWACSVGQTLFNECCGVGFMCQPYPGGGQPPSAVCAPQCRQREGGWFCGVLPDGGADRG